MGDYIPNTQKTYKSEKEKKIAQKWISPGQMS